MHTHTHTHMRMHTYAYTHAYTHAATTHAYIVFMHMYMYILYTCMCMYMTAWHTHEHTCIYMRVILRLDRMHTHFPPPGLVGAISDMTPAPENADLNTPQAKIAALETLLSNACAAR